MQCCTKKQQTIEARIVGSALVVSFSDEARPHVWRKDLTELTSSVTEIREEGGKFLLVLSDNKNGAAETIGVFTDKSAARGALQAVTSALLQGDTTFHGHAANGRKCHGHGLLGRLLRMTLWLAALAVAVLIMLFALVPPDGKRMNEVQGVKTQAPAIKPGVPVPADELFGK